MDKRIIKIADTYGYDAQSRQLIEEMAELTQAVNKFWRKKLECGKIEFDWSNLLENDLDHIIEEIADVTIMLDQMEYLLGCTDELSEKITEKLERQLQRIDSMEVEK